MEKGRILVALEEYLKSIWSNKKQEEDAEGLQEKLTKKKNLMELGIRLEKFNYFLFAIVEMQAAE